MPSRYHISIRLTDLFNNRVDTTIDTTPLFDLIGLKGLTQCTEYESIEKIVNEKHLSNIAIHFLDGLGNILVVQHLLLEAVKLALPKDLHAKLGLGAYITILHDRVQILSCSMVGFNVAYDSYEDTQVSIMGYDMSNLSLSSEIDRALAKAKLVGDRDASDDDTDMG